MIGNWKIRQDLEDSVHFLIQLLQQNFTYRDVEMIRLLDEIASFTFEFQYHHIPTSYNSGESSLH